MSYQSWVIVLLFGLSTLWLGLTVGAACAEPREGSTVEIWSKSTGSGDITTLPTIPRYRSDFIFDPPITYQGHFLFRAEGQPTIYLEIPAQLPDGGYEVRVHDMKAVRVVLPDGGVCR